MVRALYLNKGGNQLKLKEVLQLDLKKDGNKKILISELRKLPPFKDASEITLDLLDKVYLKCVDRYDVGFGYILFTKSKNDEVYYSMMLKDLEENKHITTVYGIDLLEAYAKAIITIFAYIKQKQSEDK